MIGDSAASAGRRSFFDLERLEVRWQVFEKGEDVCLTAFDLAAFDLVRRP